MRRLLIAVPIALLASAPAASAQGTTTTPVPTPPVATTPTPAPAPPATPAAPVAAKLSIAAEKVGPQRAVLSGARWRVRGKLSPYVAGQKVTVRVYEGSKKLLVKRLSVQKSSTGKTGVFVVGVAIKKVGTVTVRASHLATAELAQVVAKPQTVHVLPTHVGPGSKGLAVRILQQQLKALHYVPGAPGVFDARTGRAVLAFRKVTGMARTEQADSAVFRAIAKGKGKFKVRHPNDPPHVEANLTWQVLALIGNHGQVERIYPLSSGKPSTPTVLGHFHVYSRSPGYNSEGMYFSSYFIRGYAIHGYAEVPTYAASHGCLRVPIPDAVPIFQHISVGESVYVYYG